MRRGLRLVLSVVGLLILGAIVSFVIWGLTPSQPMPEALAALESDAQVKVTQGNWLVFKPLASPPTTGFIIYPGGHIDYRAYAPTAHQIAANGYLVVIVRMPLNLAVLNPGAAEDVIASYPDIRFWAIGGHSLGGAMSANFIERQPGTVQGLALWAAYPASGDDLSGSEVGVVSIYASLDGLVTEEELNASRLLLPSDTTWVSIAGGNHAQFGWYGDQAGDNPAAISRADQQAQVIAGTLRLLDSIR